MGSPFAPPACPWPTTTSTNSPPSTHGARRRAWRGSAVCFEGPSSSAITNAPAPSDNLKGRVIEVLENGYTLHDKVVRYAKVVVGA